MADNDVRIKMVLDTSQAEKQAKDSIAKIQKESSQIKISTSVQGGAEFDKFIEKVKAEGRNISNTKFNIGIKQVEGQSFNEIEKQYERLKKVIGGDANIFRINTQQASNSFAQIKSSIDEINSKSLFSKLSGRELDAINDKLGVIKNLTVAGFVIKFGEIGLDIIKNTLGEIKNLAGGVFADGFQLSNDFTTNKIGLANSIQNRDGVSKDEALRRANIIQNAVSGFTDVTPFTSKDGFQSAGVLSNAGFDVLAGTNNGQNSIISAGDKNILNIVSDLAARQISFLGKSSEEAIKDTSRAIVELQGGQTVSLKSRFNLGNDDIQNAIINAGLQDKVSFKTNKQTGDQELIKNTTQNLTPEDLTKFFDQIRRTTNSKGLSQDLAGTNVGLLSTIQEKVDKIKLALFGDEADPLSLAGKLNQKFQEFIAYLDSPQGQLFKQKIGEFGLKIAEMIERLATPENIERFGDALLSGADWLIGLFTPENQKKIQDGFDSISNFFGLNKGGKKEDGGSQKSGIDIIKDTGVGALSGLPSFLINPLAGLVGTGISAFFGNKLGSESGIGAGIGSFIGGVGGAIGGAAGGASLGGSIGTGVGGVIGSAFGGIGAVPGAAAGGTIGTSIGGTIGGLLGGGAGAGVGGTAGAGIGAWFSEENRNAIGKFFTQDIPAWLSQATQPIGEFFSSSGTKVGEFFTITIPTEFNKGQQYLQNWFNDRGTDFNNTITTWKTDITKFFMQDWNQILIDTATSFGIWTGERARDIINTVKSWNESVLKFFIEDIPAAQESAKTSIVNWTGERAKDFTNFSESISKSVSKFFLEDIPNFQQEAFNTFNKFFTKDIPGFIDPLPEKFNAKLIETNKYVEARVLDIAQFFADLPGNIGKSLLGIGEAIKRAFGDAGSFLSGIGNSIDKVKNAFGEGFMKGFNGGAPKANGGRIVGGSGLRDDILTPTMGGEAVLRKSAVQALDRIDPTLFERLNEDPMSVINNAARSLQASTANYYQNQNSKTVNSNNVTTKTFNPVINLNGGVKEGLNYAVMLANQSLQQSFYKS